MDFVPFLMSYFFFIKYLWHNHLFVALHFSFYPMSMCVMLEAKQGKDLPLRFDKCPQICEFRLINFVVMMVWCGSTMANQLCKLRGIGACAKRLDLMNG